MTTQTKAPKPTVPSRVARRLQKRWHGRNYYGTWRDRVLSLLRDRHPWWDWGHRLMILTGDDFGGNWQAPEPETWWYRLGPPTRMRRTGYPRHPLSTFEVIKGDYDEYRRRTDGLTEDELYEWRAIAVNQDGELILGHRWWGKPFYGLTHWEVRLLRKYLRAWHRHDWFGLRSWLYSHALHAAVHTKKPFACNEVPPRGAGGYDHWHCQLPRRHDGLHRFRNMVWGEVDGEPMRVTHVPETSNA